MYQTNAKIHSLDGAKDMVTVLLHRSSSDIIVKYKGNYCTAIYNCFVGSIYVDDLYGVLDDNARAAVDAEISNTNC